MLAAMVLRKQEIDVSWISFETPFFSADKAQKASRICDVPLMVRNITKIYMEMLTNPACGYGKNMNPCMDCHALMFRLAGEIMQERRMDFLFSGEVLGQRPMSQTRPSLRYVEKHSGFDGLILRPLSALRLSPTIPETNGWVDRERLLGIAGRGRKDQIRLAREFGIDDYPAPAGGCLLTDKNYSNRLRDFLLHADTYPENELNLLKFGRHFRLNPAVKMVVGRTHSDNQNISNCHDPQNQVSIKVANYPGPACIVSGKPDRNSLMLAASICAGYSKAPNLMPVDVQIESPDENLTVQVLGIPPDTVGKLLI